MPCKTNYDIVNQINKNNEIISTYRELSGKVSELSSKINEIVHSLNGIYVDANNSVKENTFNNILTSRSTESGNKISSIASNLDGVCGEIATEITKYEEENARLEPQKVTCWEASDESNEL